MVNILGITLSGVSQKEAIAKVKDWLNGDQPHYIVTPNPEIILAATKKSDEELFYVLNQADLSLADGIGLKFAAWLYGKRLPRATGADLVPAILKMAQTQQKKVLFLIYNQGLSSAADIEKVISAKYAGLNFAVKAIGRDILGPDNLINNLEADIVFVALGAPYQEKFIFHHRQNITNLKVAVGIGGALDFLTKKAHRAPRALRFVGLEWLWRLILNPRRIKRIFNAAIIFPYEVFKYRFIIPLKYRPNVACLLYKKEGDQYKIFLVERTLNPGHWQMPQGGTDGLSIKEAGIKELKEETGNTNFKVMSVYNFLYRYRFDSALGKWPSQRHLGYKGQKQGLLIAKFQGKDEDIKINFWDHSAYQWVDIDEAVNKVHPLRQESTKIYIEKLKEII
ncbi:MAG TPA: WecB/TagA/CpsF family glycosyltransferase [bacterium]|nr:WecB/TagA/CpsF family glycosyltransferase [bacterium]HPT29563.1 WecB/TagA/CpsF family glycosyltransferase [bacterium]